MTDHVLAPLVQTSLAELPKLAGTCLGSSHWHGIGQELVDQFAVTTRDQQWIHVDPVRASSGPYGSTVAHGYLTLSLLTALLGEVVAVSDAVVVNYGANRLRFPAPVIVGSRIRLTANCVSVDEVAGGHQAILRVVFEREGGTKPVCVAEVVFRFYGRSDRALV